jgi:MATE family multidrug resistance protein
LLLRRMRGSPMSSKSTREHRGLASTGQGAPAGVPAVRAEVRSLFALSLPVMAAQFGTMAMGVVDTVMVGHVGVDALAAAAMANAWVYGALLFGQGFMHGVDPLITQYHGAGDREAIAITFQRSLVMAVLCSLPIVLLFYWSDDFLLLVGQEPRLVAAAYDYILVQIPSIVCFLGFVSLRQYLQGRGIMRPAMWVILAANLFNAFANWLLIFGKFGFPEMGLVGAGIATGLSRGFMLIGLALFIRFFGLHRGAWVAWSRRAFEAAALRRMLALGAPVAIQMSLEIWAFSAGTLLAGRLGAVSLAAHTIVLNLAALSFMLPLGISQAAVTRVGNLLGRRDPLGARRAAWVAVAMGAGVMTLSAAAFVLLREFLPALYTQSPDVIVLAAAILPIAAVFQVFDGTQVVGCGVLRGMGRTRPAAWFNFIAYWVIGLPFGAWLGLSLGWGLAGIWWGLALGLAAVAISLVVWLRFRGPERAAVYTVFERRSRHADADKDGD